MSTTKKIPMRKCVGCQEMKNKKEMLRVLKTAEGEFILDATGRKNGISVLFRKMFAGSNKE